MWQGERVKDMAEAVAHWSLILLLALLPFFIVPVSWVSVAQAKILLIALTVLVGVIAWVLARSLEGSLTIPKNALFIFAALLPVTYAISALGGERGAASYVGGNAEQGTVVVMTLLYAILALSVLVSQNAFRSVVIYLRAFFLGSAILVVLEIVRVAFPQALSLGVLSGNASTLIGSWHDFGIILGLLVFLSLALYSTPIFEARWKWLIGTVGILSFLLLIVANWRDVWYALGVLAFLAGLYQWSAMRERRGDLRETAKRVGLWSALVLFALLSGLFSSFVYAHLPSLLQVAQTEVRPSWRGTFAVGEKVFEGGEALIFGSGPNTFGQAWGRYKPESVNATDFWNVDFTTGVGLVPTALVTVGILGLIAWGVLGILLFWSVIRFARARESASPIHALSFAALGAALYLALFQIVYAPGIGISSLTFFFLGMLVVLQGVGRGAFAFSPSLNDRKGMATLAALALVAALVALAALTDIRATVSDALVGRSAALYASSRDASLALENVRAALAVYPGNDRAERAAVELGLLELRDLSASNSPDSARIRLQERLSQTIAHGLSAVSIDDTNYQNWLALAGLYQNLAGAGVHGAYESARGAYEKAHAANPTNPLPLVRLAQLELSAGKKDAAQSDLDQALALKPDLAPALFLRSQIKAGEGAFTDAESDAKKAAELAAQDPLGWYNLGAIYYADHSYENAVASLSRAISLEGDYSNALFVLALSYDALGKKEEARGALSRVAELNPGNTSVAKLIADLERGKPLNAGTLAP